MQNKQKLNAQKKQKARAAQGEQTEQKVQSHHTHSLLALAKSAIIFFGVGVIGYIIAFFIKIISARYFGPDQLGAVELINTVLGVATLICTVGITATIPQYMPLYMLKKQYGLLRGFLRYALIVPFVVSIIAGIILFMCSKQITNLLHATPLFQTSLMIVAVVFPLKILGDSLSTVLQAKKESFHAALGHNVIDKVVIFAAVIIAMLTAKNIVVYVYGIAFSIVAIALYNAIVCYAKLSTSTDDAPAVIDTKSTANGAKEIKQIKPIYRFAEWTKFAMPLLFFGVTGYFLGWTDNIVISAFLSQAYLGIYGVAFSLASYISFIPILFLPLFLPVMVELMVKKSPALLTVYERASVWSYTIALFFGTLFLFFPAQILAVLFGPAFSTGAHPLMFLTISFTLTAYFMFCYSMLMIKKKTTFIFVNTAIFAIVNLLVNIFVLKYVNQSITAVALVTSISLFLVRFSEFVYVKRQFKLITPISHLIKVTLCAVLSGGVVKILFIASLNHTHLPQLVRLIIAGIIYCALFGGSLILSKAIMPDDKTLIKTILVKANVNQKIIDFAAETINKFS